MDPEITHMKEIVHMDVKYILISLYQEGRGNLKHDRYERCKKDSNQTSRDDQYTVLDEKHTD